MVTANGGTFYSYLVPTGKTTQPLSRELRLFATDSAVYWAAWTAYNRSRTNPRAVGAAAAKTMRDIHAIKTTCSIRGGS